MTAKCRMKQVMLLLTVLCCMVSVPQFLFAVPPNPEQYEITQVYPDRIELDNQAEFAFEIFSRSISDWEVGDVIVVNGVEGRFHDRVIQEGGSIRRKPVFYLANMTRGSMAIGFLQTPPVVTYFISQIIPAEGRVVLDDLSSWVLHPVNRSLLEIWEVGDRIMFGRNGGFFFDTYDLVLINLENESIAKVFSII